jgi:exodeoxyribonuclease VII small subunit
MAENRKEKPPRRQRLTFEEAFVRLEETVKALEAGGLTLEQATRLYEEGMRLARHCNELLSDAELRVTRLQTSFGEQMQFVEEEPGPPGGEAPGANPKDEA